VIKLGMWIQANCARMAALEKKTKRHPTDLTDEEWMRRAVPPPVGDASTKASVDLCEVLNAVRFITRCGCGWGMLRK